MNPGPPSPLERSQAGAFGLIGALMALLTLVTVVAAVLIFTIDEGPNNVGRGFLMLGISLFTALISATTFWMARRPARVPRPPEHADAGWSRGRLGPAWTDWLSLVVPPLLIGVPVVLVRDEPLDAAAFAAVLLGVGFLELIVVVALVIARREHVRVQLDPGGLRVTRRGGAQEVLRPGELCEVRLDRISIRGMTVGVLELHRTSGPSIRFREPMSAPLPDIARSCATHMNVPLTGGWS